jgi:hypothetical protein
LAIFRFNRLAPETLKAAIQKVREEKSFKQQVGGCGRAPR